MPVTSPSSLAAAMASTIQQTASRPPPPAAEILVPAEATPRPPQAPDTGANRSPPGSLVDIRV